MEYKNEEGLIILVTTCGQREDAQKLARLLVESKLAACSQVSGPITSFYWWQGKLEQDEEWQVKSKMPSENFEKALAVLKEKHPYDLPQIIAVPVTKALPQYSEWVFAETRVAKHD